MTTLNLKSIVRVSEAGLTSFAATPHSPHGAYREHIIPAPFSVDRPIQTTNPIASFESQSKPAPAGGTLRSRANDLSNFDYKGPENEPPF
ncbi:hypothetical protein MUK70_07350 [Dyadobacter chenwenxiniae]|uniref:Uncharacterized protein n=1 Tax=Dyadobacter chenwenxiniae TaxID=2906456 RepID=A0A9X1PKZ9_9BACT|nr:hypothetical protein [Dyadobacter chenwenxiniae]MCF0063030.1 hypothetical protein [Dyadobacter chenwenxiniae]UON84797.1 hypothetical protein MUK70_07350 [Dyadobacter chenwenxiniae]